MSEKVRVIRMLEYVGDRKWVEDTLQRSSVPCDGTRIVGRDKLIKSCLLDKFPSVLSDDECDKLESVCKDTSMVLDLLHQAKQILDMNVNTDEIINAKDNIREAMENIIKREKINGIHVGKNYMGFRDND